MHGTLFATSLCSLLDLLRGRYAFKHAGSLRGLPTHSDFRAYGRFRRIRLAAARRCSRVGEGDGAWKTV